MTASFYVALTQAEVIWEVGTSIEKMLLPNWPVGYFLDDDKCGRSQTPLGGATSGQVVLNAIRK